MIEQNPTAIRQAFSEDFHRPQYHFLPPSNWMNDPNGLLFWKGQTHIFYQHNPFGPLWGNMSWGHAVSDDLIHWRDLPIAIRPTPGGPDEYGCYSGSAVDNDGTPTLIYTGTRDKANIQVQCIATSDDDMITWQKHPQNPVISEVPAIANQTRDFRDPYVWREDDGWYMVVGSRIEGKAGVIFLYRSQNLVDWEYLNPLLEGTEERYGLMWECPNFFKLGDKWVLIISSHTGHSTDTVHYFVGDFVDHHFVPDYVDVLDYGTLYAPLTYVDGQDRRILFGWLRENRSDRDQSFAGWSGVQSIPRVLTLDDQNRLHMQPVPELASVRGEHFHYTASTIDESQVITASHHVDIEATYSPDASGSFGITVLGAPDGDECTRVVYDSDRQQLMVYTLTTETNGAISTHTRAAVHLLADGEALTLRILLDGSVLEVIANERTSLTARVYPHHQSQQQVRLYGPATALTSLDIWEMPSIWQ